MRFLHKPAFDGIPVHVAELLHVFSVREDVEVVVPSLPELFPLTLQLLGYLRLQYVDGCRKRMPLRLREQQVNMLRHEHIAEHEEFAVSSEPFELLLEDDARRILVQIRAATMEPFSCRCTLSHQRKRHFSPIKMALRRIFRATAPGEML